MEGRLGAGIENYTIGVLNRSESNSRHKEKGGQKAVLGL